MGLDVFRYFYIVYEDVTFTWADAGIRPQMIKNLPGTKAFNGEN